MVINVNGIKKEIPSCYEEITVKQYERILTEWNIDKPLADRDYFKLFQILCDTEFKEFVNTPENEVTIWNAVRWFVEQPFSFSSELPKVLQVDGKLITIPTKVDKLSIGQNIHLKQLLSKSKSLFDEKGNVIEYTVYSDAVAIYLQPLFDERKFDFDRAMEFKELINQMPIYLIRPIGFFLLNHARSNGTKPTSRWQQIVNNLIMSKERTLQDWRGHQDLNLLKI